MKQVFQYIFKSKYAKFMVIAMVIAMSVVSFGVATGQKSNVNAAADTCNLTINKNVTKDGKSVYATFTIRGDANCKKPVTLAVWKSPTASGQPLLAQTLYAHKSAMYGPGAHTIRVNTPVCSYWQADLLGQLRPTSLQGNADYDAMGTDALAGYLLGGRNSGGSCDKPVTPVTPSNPVTPASTTVTSVPEEVKGESLPNTGPGEIFLGLGSSAALGTAINAYIRSRKGLVGAIIG